MTEQQHAAGCAPGCARPCSRRAFLEQSAGLIALAACALGISAGEVSGWTVTATSGVTSGNDRTYPVPQADGVTIDRETQVIIVRAAGALYAFNLACPHENTALKWRAQAGRFQCPRHESRYQPDGTFIQGRATRNMDRFAVKRAGESVVVDLNRLFRSDAQAQDWSAAAVSV